MVRTYARQMRCPQPRARRPAIRGRGRTRYPPSAHPECPVSREDVVPIIAALVHRRTTTIMATSSCWSWGILTVESDCSGAGLGHGGAMPRACTSEPLADLDGGAGTASCALRLPDASAMMSCSPGTHARTPSRRRPAAAAIRRSAWSRPHRGVWGSSGGRPSPPEALHGRRARAIPPTRWWAPPRPGWRRARPGVLQARRAPGPRNRPFRPTSPSSPRCPVTRERIGPRNPRRRALRSRSRPYGTGFTPRRRAVAPERPARAGQHRYRGDLLGHVGEVEAPHPSGLMHVTARHVHPDRAVTSRPASPGPGPCVRVRRGAATGSGRRRLEAGSAGARHRPRRRSSRHGDPPRNRSPGGRGATSCRGRTDAARRGARRMRASRACATRRRIAASCHRPSVPRSAASDRANRPSMSSHRTSASCPSRSARVTATSGWRARRRSAGTTQNPTRLQCAAWGGKGTVDRWRGGPRQGRRPRREAAAGTRPNPPRRVVRASSRSPGLVEEEVPGDGHGRTAIYPLLGRRRDGKPTARRARRETVVRSRRAPASGRPWQPPPPPTPPTSPSSSPTRRRPSRRATTSSRPGTG